MIAALVCLPLLALAVNGDVSAQEISPSILIDGDEWELTREAEHCKQLVPTAIAQYRKAPIYHHEREAFGDRFLVNETPDCWIEIYIEGVDDLSFLYKVSKDEIILDQRSFSSWGPTVYAYPDKPNGL